MVTQASPKEAVRSVNAIRKNPRGRQGHVGQENNSMGDPSDAQSRKKKVWKRRRIGYSEKGSGTRVYGDAHPPATSTHWARQLPCLPSTSTISVSHLHLQPTPFSLTGSGVAQYSSSSIRFFSSSVVISRYGIRGSCLAGALAGQCWMVVWRYPKSRK